MTDPTGGRDDETADGPSDAGGTAGPDNLPAGWERRERAFRGISRRLAARYLRNLGGTLVGTDDPAEATRVEGDGWRADLSAETVNVAGSLSLTEVTVRFAGDPAALDELIPDFRQKAMRAGG